MLVPDVSPTIEAKKVPATSVQRRRRPVDPDTRTSPPRAQVDLVTSCATQLCVHQGALIASQRWRTSCCRFLGHTTSNLSKLWPKWQVSSLQWCLVASRRARVRKKTLPQNRLLALLRPNSLQIFSSSDRSLAGTAGIRI